MNVSTIHGADLSAYVPGTPDPEVVAAFEKALELAREGRLTACAIVGVSADLGHNTVLTQWSAATTEGQATMLIGLLERAKVELSGWVMEMPIISETP